VGETKPGPGDDPIDVAHEHLPEFDERLQSRPVEQAAPADEEGAHPPLGRVRPGVLELFLGDVGAEEPAVEHQEQGEVAAVAPVDATVLSQKQKIISRYSRSMADLSIAISLADRAYLYDNSIENEEARLCARTQDGLLRKIYSQLPDWIANETALLRKHEAFVDVRGGGNGWSRCE
jgi:hypothetical protein